MDQLVLAPAARRDAVLQLMRSAQNRLVLSLFRCDDFAILDEVAAAVKRNVSVRVLMTRRARGWKRRLEQLGAVLRSVGAGVQPYTGPVVKYHAKYVVADDARALVSSLNFTRKCFENTCDFLVFTDDAEVISGLKALFESDSNSPGAPPPQITERLIVGPEYARERFTRLIQEAKTSIRIVDHRVTDPNILALLCEKQSQGLLVQVLGSGPMGGLVSHGRMMLIDNTVAAIGSLHLSPPSLDFRREVAIILREAEVIAELKEFFDSLAADQLNMVRFWETPPASLIPAADDDEDEEDENATLSRA
jgi:phosphatidylserine/phosphatidylglycerophosphate/cardiolipin synthase-like enzyme